MHIELCPCCGSLLPTETKKHLVFNSYLKYFLLHIFFFPPRFKWDLYGNFFCGAVMQNHLLKGMGRLYGVKKTQPVFQLWMKGIFDRFLVLEEMLHSRGDDGWAPLGTQLCHGCSEAARRSPAPSKKLITLLWGQFVSSY